MDRQERVKKFMFRGIQDFISREFGGGASPDLPQLPD